MKEHQKLAIYFNTIGRMPRTRLFYKICQIYIRHYFGFNYGVDFDDAGAVDPRTSRGES